MKELLLKILVDLVGRMLTPEVVRKAETELVAWLKVQAAATDNPIDDSVVKIIASALGVPY